MQLYTLALPWLKSVLPYAGKYLYPTAFVAETGTVYLTVLVTINRYLAVCRPYDPPGRRSVEAARLHVLAVAVFSVVYSLPRFFEYDVVQRQVRRHVTEFYHLYLGRQWRPEVSEWRLVTPE